MMCFRQVEKTHLMENMVYNELCLHGYTVDVGVVVHNTKDVEGHSQRKQLEVDFVCNRGPERIYVQSAYALPDREKVEQEQASLLHIKDGFSKIIIVADRYLLFCLRVNYYAPISAMICSFSHK